MAIGIGLDSGPVEVNTFSGSNNDLVKFIPVAELDRLEALNKEKNIEQPAEIELTDLVSHVRHFFGVAKQAKQTIESDMLASLRQIKGEYDPQKLKAIESIGGSTDFIRLTQHKVRDTEAWIVDILDPYGDKTWDIEPTPIADLPEAVVAAIRDKVRSALVEQYTNAATMQGQPFDAAMLEQKMEEMQKVIEQEVKKMAHDLAEKRARNMKQKILDQLDEGGWNDALGACANDLSKLKACIMKGPVYKRKSTIKWEQVESGEYAPNYSLEVIPTFSRVSPFDWYPAPNSRHAQDGGGIEIEHLSKDDLRQVMNESGYYKNEIKWLFDNYPNGFKEASNIESERQDLEKDNTIKDDITDTSYDMINYWDNVSGEKLVKYDMVDNYGEPIKEDKFYNVNIKIINNKLIKKPSINPDPLGHKPYGVTAFIKSNDSQWGECPAELMKDIQSICNATVRALVNNIAIASGPVTEIDQGRLAPGESGQIHPWKRILTTNQRMQESRAIHFYQAKLLANELMAVYEKFKREADDIVVPSYGRSNIGGAGRTSSGLAMLMSAAARNVKLAVYNVDRDLIVPRITSLFNFNMLFVDDESIKGDIKVKARGTSGILAKEQLAMRRNEFRATLRPTDEQLLGQKGVAYILRKTLESLEIDPDKAMPNFKYIDDGSMDFSGLFQGESSGQAGQGSPPRPQALDVAGQPMGGSDETSLFRQAPIDQEGAEIEPS